MFCGGGCRVGIWVGSVSVHGDGRCGRRLHRRDYHERINLYEQQRKRKAIIHDLSSAMLDVTR